jgi:hypothetical protein
MSSCCGSSCAPPGSPRSVVITSVGTLKIMLSEVSGLTVLPKPEFWNITTERCPPRSAPAAMPTASPSLVAPTYRRSGASMT